MCCCKSNWVVLWKRWPSKYYIELKGLLEMFVCFVLFCFDYFFRVNTYIIFILKKILHEKVWYNLKAFFLLQFFIHELSFISNTSNLGVMNAFVQIYNASHTLIYKWRLHLHRYMFSLTWWLKWVNLEVFIVNATRIPNFTIQCVWFNYRWCYVLKLETNEPLHTLLWIFNILVLSNSPLRRITGLLTCIKAKTWSYRTSSTVYAKNIVDFQK